MAKTEGVQRRLPSLDLIKGFEAAARHLSFTRAAGELFLTQSALSRQIQALEEQLGVALFERRHRALLLTDAGQVLQGTAAPCSINSPTRSLAFAVTSQRSLWRSRPTSLSPRCGSFRA